MCPVRNWHSPRSSIQLFFHDKHSGNKQILLPEGEKTEENVLRVRKEFIPYYDIHNADDSRPYPGIPELLTDLQSAETLTYA